MTTQDVFYFLWDLLYNGSVANGLQLAWGALIGAAVSAISAGIGAAASASNAKKNYKAQLARNKSERDANEAWFNRKYNEDATNTADAQLALRRVNDEIRKRTQSAMGRKNVIGGTDASMATQQQYNAEAMGNTLGDTIANAERRKDGIEAQYRNRDQELSEQRGNIESNYATQKSQNTAQAVSGMLSAAASAAASAADSNGKATRSSLNDGVDNSGLTQAKAQADQWKTTQSDKLNKSIGDHLAQSGDDTMRIMSERAKRIGG